MTDYKLVPVEPTHEMLEAGADWSGQGLGTDEAKGRAATAYKSMLAAAPTVQSEPVGYGLLGAISKNWDGKTFVPKDEADGYDDSALLPLYAAPQPAEQQPISHDWDDQDKCRRCGDRDWYASATCTPKPQTAPDVDVLVEALESLVKGYVNLLEAGRDRITSLGGDCDPVPIMEHNDPWLRDARAALAAYRKQGGEK